MAFVSILSPPPSCLEMDNIIKWNPDIFFDSIPINDIPLLPTYALELSYGDKPTFSPIVTFPNGQWTSIDVWMTTLGYPLFGGYHRFPKEVLFFIYQTAMRGKRMRLFAYRVWLANLLRHPLEFTLPYFPDDELQLELEEWSHLIESNWALLTSNKLALFYLSFYIYL